MLVGIEFMKEKKERRKRKEGRIRERSWTSWRRETEIYKERERGKICIEHGMQLLNHTSIIRIHFSQYHW
jgi:hypothetical protein